MTDSQKFLQQLINGLSLGSIYALIALGYTMVYGILRFINFAHSDVFMVGAFAGYYINLGVQRNHAAAQFMAHHPVMGGIAISLVSMVICALLGVVIERLAYRPLRGSSNLAILITAIGVSLLLENLTLLICNATPKSFPPLIPEKNISFGGVSLTTTQVVVFAVTGILLGALQWIVLKTRMGAAMRAVSFNFQAASLVGINNDRVISFTFALGSALAAAGGILWASLYPTIDPYMGVLPGLKAFVAAVLGGIGNIPGAALGGLLLGLIEAFVNGSHYSTYTDAIAFAALILVLLFRPAGLLGKFQVEKV
jgi:branched-chain amino acid transport system permease protein